MARSGRPRVAGRRLAALVALGLLIPGVGSAKVDAACGIGATSAIEGHVRNVKGDLLPQIHIELRQTNKDGPVSGSTFTDNAGFYRVCLGHDAYDVRAFDDLGGLYATANQAAQTFTDPSGDTDFVLEYKLNLSISPQAVSIPAPLSTQTVTWTIRSKAPCATYPSSCTDMQMTLDHLPSTTIHPAFVGTEFGGPSGGGWNLWRYQAALSYPLPERAYFANVSGYAPDNAAVIRRTTEQAIDPYFVDNQAPLFGPAGGSTGVNCGAGAIGGPFTPTQTTNPQALITVGVCDLWSNGGRSSLDPYSVKVEVFDAANNPVPGGGQLSQLSIIWLPSGVLAPGAYKFRYTVKDNAGNQTVSGFYTLNVTTTGGSVPTLTGFVPGNLGEGANLGVVVGSGFTTPTSRAVVAFYAKDADGQLDLAAGSLRVRVYASDGRTLLYDYDPLLAPVCSPDVAPPGNTGCFNQGTGRFEASGFSLVGRPPGLYLATASIEDHGGNATTKSWRWLQVVTL